MKVSVKAIRQHGIRLNNHQISSLPATEGYISVYGLGTTIQLSLYDGSGKQEPLLPSLYEARLVTMHGAQMLFAGIQRTADPMAAQYFQEWSVFILPMVDDEA